MNNKTIGIVVVVVIVLGLGIGGYMMMRSTPGPATVYAPVTNTAQQPAQPASQGQGTLKDLLTMKTPQTCTITTGAGADATSGTSYIANGKMRTDMTGTVAGKTMVAHMVIDSSTVHTWIDGTTMGFTMTVKEPAPAEANPNTSSTSASFDTGAAVDYDCAPWVVDATKFELPTNITFKDYTKATVPTPPSAQVPKGTASQCAACDELPATSQVECRTALGC